MNLELRLSPAKISRASLMFLHVSGCLQYRVTVSEGSGIPRPPTVCLRALRALREGVGISSSSSRTIVISFLLLFTLSSLSLILLWIQLVISPYHRSPWKLVSASGLLIRLSITHLRYYPRLLHRLRHILFVFGDLSRASADSLSVGARRALCVVSR